jgi:uncharacterized protein affecting Mg2+/Co2+ transport
MGAMRGNYTFLKLMDHTEFKVDIPKFDLIVPGKLN